MIPSFNLQPKYWEPQRAVRYFHNTTVVTGTGRVIPDGAVIEEDGVIRAVDRSGRCSPPAGCERIDLDGGYLFPGLADAHGHLLSMGRMLEELNIQGLRSFDEVVRAAAEWSKRLPPNAWVRGRGWDQNLWDDKVFPHHRGLSAATAGRPACLVRVDGHAVLVSKAALDLAGITAKTPDPPGGRIVHDASGEPTGVLLNNAMGLVTSKMPQPAAEDKRRMILAAARKCAAVGLTAVHDAGMDSEDVDLCAALAREGALPVRVYAMARSRPLDGPVKEGLFTCRAVKVLADGALGSRGAALMEPYSDAPGQAGISLMSEDEILDVALQCLEAGFQLAVHAIGDRAVHETLNAFKRAFRERPAGDHRFRIEHLQVVGDGDFARFGKLGVIPSVQPAHFDTDSAWYADLLGSERAKTAYAWKRLLDSAGTIALGSDFPIENNNPLTGFRAALRHGPRDMPGADFHPEQRLSRKEALAGYTTGCAHASFSESSLGALEPGMAMDATHLSHDILAMPEAEIGQARVRGTIVAGNLVY
jgi:predicted amidohydrolase YtcJ